MCSWSDLMNSSLSVECVIQSSKYSCDPWSSWSCVLNVLMLKFGATSHSPFLPEHRVVPISILLKGCLLRWSDKVLLLNFKYYFWKSCFVTPAAILGAFLFVTKCRPNKLIRCVIKSQEMLFLDRLEL